LLHTGRHVGVEHKHLTKNSDTFAALWTSTRLDNLGVNMKSLAKENLGYHELQQHKSHYDAKYFKLLDQRRQIKLHWLMDE
jgi:hypothetical protein